MPTTYTHYKFALRVQECLPEEYRQIIFRHPDLYYMGAMGPDLLFYTLPSMYTYNISNETHKRSGKDWFSHMGRVLLEQGTEEKWLAYLYGYLTHYAADRACHAYIDACAEEGIASHYLTEAEWDRYYLVRDGYDPLKKKLTDHIVVSWNNAKLISEFYTDVNAGWIFACMVGSHIMLDALVMPNELKRGLLHLVADLADKFMPGAGQQFKDMAIAKKPVAVCQPICETLDHMLFGDALSDALDFITGYLSAVKEDTWDEKYDYNFEGGTL